MEEQIPKATERCGAKTRAGGKCQRWPNKGKRRCKLHGGMSTGPKTEEGRRRQVESIIVSGSQSNEAKAQKAKHLPLLTSLRLLNKDLDQFKQEDIDTIQKGFELLEQLKEELNN